jgi:hypothetical protein
MFPRFWKILFVICLASVSLADEFKTTNGKEYKNVTVSRQEPDGIFVTNAKAGVMVKLYFAELPKEVQERFGYKPEKAVAYQSAQLAAFDQAQVASDQAQKDSSRQKSEVPRQQTETVTGSGGGSGQNRGSGGSVHVSGYYRKDGTYVHPHTRAAPGAASHSRKR